MAPEAVPKARSRNPAPTAAPTVVPISRSRTRPSHRLGWPLAKPGLGLPLRWGSIVPSEKVGPAPVHDGLRRGFHVRAPRITEQVTELPLGLKPSCIGTSTFGWHLIVYPSLRWPRTAANTAFRQHS